ncbi:MAG: hypothetical protein HYW27_01075 [Candidatus Aenigmarchaeota archaeon]|nr:hypothetical protein [Candidatus Aenigmarchaeota archaeon]
MKGFIRILESIIASVVILSALTFFFAPSVKSLGWEESNLHLEVYDTLESLYKSGSLAEYVRNNDASGLNSELSSIIKKNIDFSVSVSGIPDNDILIGCVCTDGEKDSLENIMSPREFGYHGRGIRIGVEKTEILQNTILIRRETDVLFFFGYNNLSQYKTQIDKFLAGGGGVFMLADITEDQTETIKSIFGIEWEPGGAPSGNGVFYGNDFPANISFKVYKYFSNMSGDESGLGKFNKGPSVNRIGVDDDTIIIDRNGMFSLAKGRKTGPKGRTVWMADYDRIEGNTSILIKSAVMWSGGEFYRLDPTRKNIPQSTGRAGILVYDMDPYEIGIDYWKIF